MKYIVKVERTQNKFINKFEVNEFITNHLSFEYNNIDDAKNSKLAQELFYLPFVKKVYITSSFISVERFNIVEWDDVEEEVKKLIENYLNSGRKVISEAEKNKSNPISIYTESTPNPAVLKFVSNKLIVEDSFEFNNIEEAQEMEFAKKLFEFSYIKSIYISKNFISITKYDVKNWDEVSLELRNFIKNYLENNIITSSSNKIEVDKNDLDEISKKIVSILDEYIKPAVASDGGNILFDSYDPQKKLVKVVLQGACSGCPSSTVTLKNGIDAFNISGLTVTKYLGTLELSRVVSGTRTAFAISCQGGPANNKLTVFQDQVDNVAQLPIQSFQDHVVKVINTASANDTYFAKFVADNGVSGNGFWQETRAPSKSAGLDGSTMPQELVNTALNNFTFRQ